MKKILIIPISMLVIITVLSGCTTSRNITITKFEDLGKEGITIAIGNPEHVPAGRYAMEVINNLRESNPKLAEKIENNIVSKDFTVRAVLDKVITREVDAGFIYKPDAIMEGDKVKIIEIPKEINVFPEYSIAVLRDSDNKKEGEEFIKFIVSKEGQEILKKYGYIGTVRDPKFYTPKHLNGSIVVYGGAGMANMLKEMGKEFERKTGCRVNFLFASSGTLTQRIKGGAVGGENGADVFATPSLRYMEILKRDGFVEDYKIFAKSELVVVIPK
ncbi:molybdate ABC transporter substrate-binding protein [Methanothermococcus sp. SCGC AD-155-C09]|nr:molybdate ABC transporter substrate-binding protein [Methanothermococcus sp. SCGC AD-155-C09]